MSKRNKKFKDKGLDVVEEEQNPVLATVPSKIVTAKEDGPTPKLSDLCKIGGFSFHEDQVQKIEDIKFE